MSRVVLGLNAYHADASAALFVDGDLRYAIEEERLNRRKHCGGFPGQAVQACMQRAGLQSADIDHIAVSRDSRALLARKALYIGERALRALTDSSAERARFLAALSQRIDNRTRLHRLTHDLEQSLGTLSSQTLLHPVEHHRAHLASAFFCSDFAEAAALSVDGFGDFSSTMWAVGQDRQLQIQNGIHFPHSLGVLYTAVTQWLGFRKYGDEGKIMGLSAYGQPTLLPRLRALVNLRPDGTFALNLSYFRHHREGVDMSFGADTPHVGILYSPALCDLLGSPRPAGPGIEEEPYYCDVAASLQALLNEAMVHICRHLQRRTKQKNLCLAGGVALNCVANAAILEQTDFQDLFIQPAAGDNGTAIGAALWVEHQVLHQPRRFVMRHAYTGPVFDDAACQRALDEWLATQPTDLRIERLSDEARCIRAAAAIAQGAVVGWFAGAMEFGPRALGHRSILCDPRRADMKDRLNRRIKHREPFRPFAPAILAERVHEWFERGTLSPAMLLVDRVRPEKRAMVPAITHRDGTGRLQTVSAETCPLFHRLLHAFEQTTGVPLVLNTSFNEHEPIVCTPMDALRCFAKTHMDVLVLGPFFIERTVG
ncbi:MAG: carbamoyltransferase [Myxococcales bacterium]|nr:carbamoyltransferase [Myxococcales bacterium]